MENEKNLNSVLKDELNVSIDYLNVVFTSDKIWSGKGFIWHSFWERGYTDITKVFVLMV